MRLIYHPDAEMELIEAAQFYERRVSTLGSQFLDAADIAIGEIQNAPERWNVIEADGVTSCPASHTPSTTGFFRIIFVSLLSSTTAATQITGATVSPTKPND